MSEKTLSIIPYYGGKAHMAHFIAERLNYDDSDVFVTPFGGACRVLLNKPRHPVECYNDFGTGLCTMMEMLSNPKDARDFIHALYETTEYSKDEFDRQKKIYDSCEIDLEQQTRIALRKFLTASKIISAQKVNEMLDTMILQAFDSEAKVIQVDSKQAEAVRRVFELKHMCPWSTLQEIADTLNVEGYRGKNGGNFNVMLVKRILSKRSFYMGVYKYSEIETYGKHEAII